MSEQRRTMLEAEIVRLEAEIVALDRQWSRKHRLGIIGLAAIPLLIARVEPVFVVLAILASPALVATQAYLLYVRRRECRDLIAQAEVDLERVKAGAPLIGRLSSPTAAASDRAARPDAPPRTPR